MATPNPPSTSKFTDVHVAWDDALNAAVTSVGLRQDGTIACIASAHDVRLLLTSSPGRIYADETTHVTDVSDGFAHLPCDANEFQLYDVHHTGLRQSTANATLHVHSPLLPSFPTTTTGVAAAAAAATAATVAATTAATKRQGGYDDIKFELGACTLFSSLIAADELTSILLVYPTWKSLRKHRMMDGTPHRMKPPPLSLHRNTADSTRPIVLPQGVRRGQRGSNGNFNSNSHTEVVSTDDVVVDNDDRRDAHDPNDSSGHAFASPVAIIACDMTAAYTRICGSIPHASRASTGHARTMMSRGMNMGMGMGRDTMGKRMTMGKGMGMGMGGEGRAQTQALSLDQYHQLLAHGLALQMRWDFGFLNDVTQLRYGPALEIIREHYARRKAVHHQRQQLYRQQQQQQREDQQQHQQYQSSARHATAARRGNVDHEYDYYDDDDVGPGLGPGLGLGLGHGHGHGHSHSQGLAHIRQRADDVSRLPSGRRDGPYSDDRRDNHHHQQQNQQAVAGNDDSTVMNTTTTTTGENIKLEGAIRRGIGMNVFNRGGNGEDRERQRQMQMQRQRQQQQQQNDQQSRVLGYQYQHTSSTSGSTEPTSTRYNMTIGSGSASASGSGGLAAAAATAVVSGGMTIGEGHGHGQVVADAGDEESDLTAGVIHSANLTTVTATATATATNTGGAEGQFDLDELDHDADLHVLDPHPPHRRLSTTLHGHAHNNAVTATSGDHGVTLDLDILGEDGLAPPSAATAALALDMTGETPPTTMTNTTVSTMPVVVGLSPIAPSVSNHHHHTDPTSTATTTPTATHHHHYHKHHRSHTPSLLKSSSFVSHAAHAPLTRYGRVRATDADAGYAMLHNAERYVVHGRAEMLRDVAPPPELLWVLQRMLDRFVFVALGVPGLTRSHLLVRHRMTGQPRLSDVQMAADVLTDITAQVVAMSPGPRRRRKRKRNRGQNGRKGGKGNGQQLQEELQQQQEEEDYDEETGGGENRRGWRGSRGVGEEQRQSGGVRARISRFGQSLAALFPTKRSRTDVPADGAPHGGMNGQVDISHDSATARRGLGRFSTSVAGTPDTGASAGVSAADTSGKLKHGGKSSSSEVTLAVSISVDSGGKPSSSSQRVQPHQQQHYEDDNDDGRELEGRHGFESVDIHVVAHIERTTLRSVRMYAMFVCLVWSGLVATCATFNVGGRLGNAIFGRVLDAIVTATCVTLLMLHMIVKPLVLRHIASSSSFSSSSSYLSSSSASASSSENNTKKSLFSRTRTSSTSTALAFPSTPWLSPPPFCFASSFLMSPRALFTGMVYLRSIDDVVSFYHEHGVARSVPFGTALAACSETLQWLADCNTWFLSHRPNGWFVYERGVNSNDLLLAGSIVGDKVRLDYDAARSDVTRTMMCFVTPTRPLVRRDLSEGVRGVEEEEMGGRKRLMMMGKQGLGLGWMGSVDVHSGNLSTTMSETEGGGGMNWSEVAVMMGQQQHGDGDGGTAGGDGLSQQTDVQRQQQQQHDGEDEGGHDSRIVVGQKFHIMI